MAIKIFITGTTGYIGGDVLYALQKAHPEYEYTALVRNSDGGAKIAAVYPAMRLVYGTLDDAELITTEAARADVVLHTADSSDHVVAAQAIAKGLAQGHSTTQPGFWIHLSGTGILIWSDSRRKRYGEAPDSEPYDDLERVDELTTLPDDAFHRNVDKIVLGAASAAVKTAIVSPPTIFGIGRGEGNQLSRQTNKLIRVTLEHGRAPILGTGRTEWDHVHIHDLSDLLVLLVTRAATDLAGTPAPAASPSEEVWGARGYYLAASGHHTWGAISHVVAETAHAQNLIPAPETVEISSDQALAWGGFEALSWGLNSRGIARRARTYLGWNPSAPGIVSEMPETVRVEATRAGVVKGHRQIVQEATK